ncbi:proline-rich protein 32 [Sorex araneus]|uniref:proline-rich protein 32 n=1 Tax=Sorex araneus TaxID=42254 RepID=UPI002433FB7B|nr:proline-rich protein 32 [Sorex araneus]
MPANVESWAHPCAPVLLSPPFHEMTDLTREQLDRPSERTGPRIPLDNLRAQHSYGPPPAVTEASLATAEVNSSGALAGLRQRGRDSINVSGKPPALMTGGTRANNGGSERGSSNVNLYSSFPRGQGVFPARRPQIRNPPRVPFLTSGIMMELPPINLRAPYKDRLAQVSFPRGGPQNPADNWSRPGPLTSNTQGLPSGPTAHGFVNPQHPSFNPLLPLPIAFAPPPIVNPPQQSPYATYPSWGISDPACPKRESK